MPRRNAATLVEVLVAIFVMGIGLLALFALFPLGALRMAQAIQDDRVANIAQNADAIATMFSLRTDSGLSNPNDPFMQPGTLPNGNALGASYPVLVDPTGWVSASGLNSQFWLGGISGTIPRRSVSFVNNPPAGQTSSYAALRWFGFLDDIQFDTTGSTPGFGFAFWAQAPSGPPANQPAVFYRDLRFSIAYLLQKPRNADKVVNLSTLVFNRRSLALSGNLTLSEYVYDGNGTTNKTQFDLSRNVVTVDYGAGGAPPIRLGEWVMDATPVTSPYASAHGYFYRVVGMNDNGNNTIDYELQTPIRGFAATSYGRVIVLEGLAEVVERGAGRTP